MAQIKKNRVACQEIFQQRLDYIVIFKIHKPYDFEPKTLGEHIRKRRRKLGLMQKEIADQLGVNPWTVLNWENGHTVPPIGSMPTVVRFLGYDPFPQPQTLAEHLLAKRREMGWSVKEAAQVLGVDPMTWRNWECGKAILYHRHRTAVTLFLDLSDDILECGKVPATAISHTIPS